MLPEDEQDGNRPSHLRPLGTRQAEEAFSTDFGPMMATGSSDKVVLEENKEEGLSRHLRDDVKDGPPVEIYVYSYLSALKLGVGEEVGWAKRMVVFHH